MTNRFHIHSICAFVLLLLPGTAQLYGQLPIERIANVSFKVHDLASARSFYTGMLGLPETFDLKGANGEVTSAFFQINDDQYIEFTLNASGPDHQFESVSFLTPKVTILQRLLQKRGLSPVGPLTGADGDLHLSLKDPMGNTLDFVAYRKGSLQSAHRGNAVPSVNGAGKIQVTHHLLHVGLAEDDEAAALAFYENKLGFQEMLRGSTVPNQIYWINMAMPEDRGDYIEMMVHAVDPASRRNHICFEVPDIQKAYQLLVSQGMPDHFKPRIASNHRWVINLGDPNGIRVEIMGEPVTEPLPHPAQ
jgi:catechol 2,3-dioxygenase-like lactoylglutathione lyase family enzyme